MNMISFSQKFALRVTNFFEFKLFLILKKVSLDATNLLIINPWQKSCDISNVSAGY